jgi:hypothetical protein
LNSDWAYAKFPFSSFPAKAFAGDMFTEEIAIPKNPVTKILVTNRMVRALISFMAVANTRLIELH